MHKHPLVYCYKLINKKKTSKLSYLSIIILNKTAMKRQPVNDRNELNVSDKSSLDRFILNNNAALLKRHKAPGIVGANILIHLYYKGPSGLSNLSRVVRKAVPTIQGHICHLTSLNLIEYSNKRATLTSAGYQYIDYYRELFNGRLL